MAMQKDAKRRWMDIPKMTDALRCCCCGEENRRSKTNWDCWEIGQFIKLGCAASGQANKQVGLTIDRQSAFSQDANRA